MLARHEHSLGHANCPPDEFAFTAVRRERAIQPANVAVQHHIGGMGASDPTPDVHRGRGRALRRA